MNLSTNNQVKVQNVIPQIHSTEKEDNCIICKSKKGTVTYRHKKICRDCLKEIQSF